MTLKELANVELQQTLILDKTRSIIKKRILTTELPGVTQLSSNCCAVKVSDGSSWVPEYYIRDRQAEAVDTELAKCHTAIDFITAADKMLQTGYAAYGTLHRVPLNEVTLKIIQEEVI